MFKRDGRINSLCCEKKLIFNLMRSINCVSVIVVWAILLAYVPKTISTDNMIYALGEYRAYDTSLFKNSLYMSEGVISPRWIVDAFFAFFMKVNGGNWSSVVLWFTYINVFILSVAVVKIVKNICEIFDYQLPFAIVLALLMAENGNELANFRLVDSTIASMGLGTALAMAVLAISYVVGEHKDFGKAYCILGISVLFHIHEGLYGFIVVIIFALVDLVKNKRDIKEHIGILLYLFLILSVVVPNILTDSMSITNREFVNIYAIFRHPHHLLPSFWGASEILRSLMIIISLMIFKVGCSLLFERNKFHQDALVSGLLISAWGGAILLVYFFTEKVPLACVSTLYFPKIFKYIVLISLIWIVQISMKLIQRRFYLSGLEILYYAFMNHNWSMFGIFVFFALVCLLCYGEYRSKACKNNSIWLGRVLVLIFFVQISFGLFFNINENMQIILILCAVLCIFVFLMIKKNTIVYFIMLTGMAVLVCILTIYGRLWWIEEGNVVFQNGEHYLIATVGDNLKELADSFEAKTQKEEAFIADPEDTMGAGWFQVVSQRNCYVLKKVVPSVKCSMEEWYNRLMQTEGLLEKSTEEIKQIMLQADVDYIMVKNDYYEKIDLSGDFQVFIECRDDSYRIYKLV